MKTKKITLFLMANVLCLSSFTISAKEIFANAAIGDDTKDGLTIENSVKTIPQAYALAEAGDVIKLDGTFLFENFLTIEKTGLTIQSVGSTKAVLDGDNAFYFFEIKSAITLKNLTFTKGYGGDGGALVFPLGFERDVKIQDCLFTGNEAGNRGGAIWYVTYGLPDKLTIDRCAFVNNLAGSHGGVIGFIPEGGDTNHGSLTINNSTFAQNNNLTGGGGVLFADGGATNNATFNFNNVTISGNVGGDNGGNCPGFRFIGNKMAVNIKNSVIEGNVAADGQFYDISFTDVPTSLTIQNSIVGNVTNNGGTLDPSTFVAVGSNVNNMKASTDESVAGLGEFANNYFMLSTGSLAYSYGKMESVTPETIVDQLGKTRTGEALCSAGAVEFFSFSTTGLNKNQMPNTLVSTSKGLIRIQAENASAKVYNVSGVLVGHFTVNGEASLSVKSGLYLVQLESGSNKKVSKIIVN